MQVNKPQADIQVIALGIVCLSVFVACFAFYVGRGDPETKQPIVLAMVSLISGLLGLGGGILTSGNKNNLPSVDAPPGSSISSATTQRIQTPPDPSTPPPEVKP
jgi:uncharacterized protein involved in response to NO